MRFDVFTSVVVVFALSLVTRATAGVVHKSCVGDLCSYYVFNSNQNEADVLVDNLPSGFVITDVYLAHSETSSRKGIWEGDPSVSGVVRTKVDPPLSRLYHYNSGIVLAAGSDMYYRDDIDEASEVVISGYIPSASSGNVPAVGGWALIVLTLAIAGGATVIMRRATA